MSQILTFLLIAGITYFRFIHNSTERIEIGTNKRRFLFRWYHFYKDENLMLAYMYLSMDMMRLDKEDLKSQQSLMLDKLKRRFGTWSLAEIKSTYLSIIRQFPETDNNLLFKWINSKATELEKMHLLDVLADLAFHNNLVTQGEYKFLYHVGQKLNIPIDTVRSIISIRQSRLNSQQNQQNSTQQSRITNKESLVKRKLHVLGLNHAKNQEDIKQAYRKLAKIYHPDRYANQSKSEQKMAHERFIEIKAAYDYLMAHFG